MCTKISLCNGTQILVNLPNKEMSKEVENRRETQFDLVWGWKHAWAEKQPRSIFAIKLTDSLDSDLRPESGWDHRLRTPKMPYPC